MESVNIYDAKSRASGPVEIDLPTHRLRIDTLCEAPAFFAALADGGDAPGPAAAA